MTKQILIIAGESSGDQHGAKLALQLLQANNPSEASLHLKVSQSSQLKITAMGGQHLRQAGAEILVDSSELAVVGFIEIIKVFSKIWRAFKAVSQYIKKNKPDLVILIDYPGFNLRMAKVASRAGCKVLYYISPQLWAWHQSRVKIVRKYVDQMAVILPFEVDFYRQHGVQAAFVGHPLASDIAKIPDQLSARKSFNLSSDELVIGLLPGSRNAEIKSLLPTLIATVQTLKATYPKAKFLLPLAANLSQSSIQAYFQEPHDIQITHDLYPTLAACNLVIAASGTVTLQAGIANTPMIVLYRSSPLSHAIAKHLVTSKYICLCNIIADQEIVKELVQHEATVDNIVMEAKKILEDTDYCQQMQQKLNAMTKKLTHTDQTMSLTTLVHRLVSNLEAT